MDKFEYVTRNKVRFSSTKGELSVEQLWDVPLRSKDDFNLDTIARAASRALESASEVSFVDAVKKHPSKLRAEAAFEVIKHVISVKLAEEDETKKRADNRVEKDKLLKILAEKQDGKLSTLTEKELQDRINALQ